MAEFIIDTNVPLVASDEGPERMLDCPQTCRDFLDALFFGENALVLDNTRLILGEYERAIKGDDLNSYAKQFLKWIYTNEFRIKTVEITQIDEYNFEEVPDSILQAGFDNADRKFVAVAVANEKTAPIVQASDSKWIGWESVLVAEDIEVNFICRREIEAQYEAKHLV